jgi:hypothetical protein
MNANGAPGMRSNTMDPRAQPQQPQQPQYRGIAPSSSAAIRKPETKKRKVIEEDDDSDEDSDGDYMGDGTQGMGGGSQSQLPGGRL